MKMWVEKGDLEYVLSQIEIGNYGEAVDFLREMLEQDENG
jgi:hypothetical protein